MPTLNVGENTYITIEEANTYFDDRLYVDDWYDLTDEDKARALIMATENIDNQIFQGQKKDEDQSLEFPRTYYSSYTTQSDDDVPENVKKAQSEEAFTVVKFENSYGQRQSLIEQGVTSVKIGNFAENYKDSADRKLLSKTARLYLNKYLMKTGGIV